MRQQIFSMTGKELRNYFGSPLAFIFVGTFLAAVLFIFFTIETFFVRGIADIRPLFVWMPVLLIFLMAALTMRQWSEEERSGTRELLLTLPVSDTALVLGKFTAVMVLMLLALALTLPLPVTVNLLGDLDWGPVWGGYLAAVLLAGSYAAVGLFVSSRTDNQIVALILTVLLGGAIYLLGTRAVTDFVGGTTADLLRSLGTGSRFESIQRGVVDLRDLVYYLSLTAVFLALNVVSLAGIGWSETDGRLRRTAWLTTGLLIGNLLLLNIWPAPLDGLRIDLTEQQIYSLSPATVDLVENVNEPLTIRAFISENNHPLLSPLVPRIEDMLREYEIAGDGNVTAEVVDPTSDPDLEIEVTQTYGIEPRPFQVAGRYESSVINAYFDIVIEYGDQNEIISFNDLIQVRQGVTGIEVSLQNLEYDLTSSIQKVVYGFQSIESVLAELNEPAEMTLYVTPGTIPPELDGVPGLISSVAQEYTAGADGNLVFEVVNLEAPDGPGINFLQQTYGIQPIPVSFLSNESFYAHTILHAGDRQPQLIYPPNELNATEVRTQMETALRRLAPGFLRVVGVWTPPPTAPDPTGGAGGGQTDLTNYSAVIDQLRQEYEVRRIDLSTGQIAADVDVLLLFGPRRLTDRNLFTLDQYLMRGGTVVVAANANKVVAENSTGRLLLQPADTDNVLDWLAHHGVAVDELLVMDTQNRPFPIIGTRNVNGFQVQDVRAVDYPFFIDVRDNGMADHPVLAGLPAVTLNWTSPVRPTETLGEEKEATVLMRSSSDAWVRSQEGLPAGTGLQPNYDLYPETGFEVPGERDRYPLAVALTGRFDSYYTDRENPFDLPPEDPAAAAETETNAPVGLITASPEDAQLLVIGSSAFVEDYVLNLSASVDGEGYVNSLQFVQNGVNWAVEDAGLLSIRARGSVARVLRPLGAQEQSFWEMMNYVVAAVLLGGVYAAQRMVMREEKPVDLSAALARAETAARDRDEHGRDGGEAT